jgi:hypothetical protein
MDPPPDGRTVVYFGLLSTVPNVDGVIHFIRDTLQEQQAAGARPVPGATVAAGRR